MKKNKKNENEKNLFDYRQVNNLICFKQKYMKIDLKYGWNRFSICNRIE
jgi:hypothetical protein